MYYQKSGSYPQAILSHSWACTVPREIDMNLGPGSTSAAMTIARYCSDFFEQYFLDYKYKMEKDVNWEMTGTETRTTETKSQKRRRRRKVRKNDGCETSACTTPQGPKLPLSYTISFTETRIQPDFTKTLILNVGSDVLKIDTEAFCKYITLRLNTYVKHKIMESGYLSFTEPGVIKALKDFHLYYLGNMYDAAFHVLQYCT
ncbi:hypothetical protein [Saguinine gammaherpesvirus 1]|uniref:Uncharacterized protein n=1 Tax=Saguinine gammaherpesvirus 1 TaxID=2169901 RepID=A0A9Q8QX22_9GAMA|nr:hypothetical protein [Saguinine gammaherpesvirus 1]